MEILLAIVLLPIKMFFSAAIKTIFKEFVKHLYDTYGYESTTYMGNIVLGAVLGIASLVVIPQHITPNIQIRIVNLIITPLIFGALLNLSSNIKFYRVLYQFDRVNFASGCFFALTMAGVRFIFAR